MDGEELEDSMGGLSIVLLGTEGRSKGLKVV